MCLCIAFACHARADDAAKYPEAPKPLSPAESQAAFVLPEGFGIREVAAEPLIVDPVAIAFDARGRLFVAELHGYNLEGQLDIEALNKTGVIDRAVRRIPANKQAIERAEQDTFGRIKLLEDRDGDGVMDHAAIWADRLPACHGLVAVGEKLIVVCAPEIVCLSDTSGDGQADTRETLFTGFGVGALWTRINTPRLGIDNWIYVASGAGCAGTIHGPHLGEPVKLGNTSFRFKLDGTALEPVTGSTHGFGLTINDWGDRFIVTNRQHAIAVSPIEARYATRNQLLILPPQHQNISGYGTPAQVFPLSKPHPWRMIRSQDPEWVKFYGTMETNAGFFTSACSPLVYLADQFPEQYRGVHFSCEPEQNLVHACRLIPNGGGYVTQRMFPDREFLASRDQWFRPVYLTHGPNGSLYVADMYREIIEDYSAIPRFLQQHYGLINGNDRGRIWQISWLSAAEAKATPSELADLPTLKLVEVLGDGNFWRREQAQALLVSRCDATAVDPLQRMATEGRAPQTRVHALHTLDGSGQLEVALLEKALHDKSALVQMHAIALSEPRLNSSETLRAQIVSMIHNDHPRVRLQAVLSLGQCSRPEIARAVSRSLMQSDMNEYLVSAAFCRPLDSTQLVLAELLTANRGKTSVDLPMQTQLVHSACRIVGASRDVEQIASVIFALSHLANDEPAVTVSALRGLVEGLGKSRVDPSEFMERKLKTAVLKLASTDNADVRRLTLRLVLALHVSDLPELREAYESFVKKAVDDATPLADRVAALEVLAGTDYTTLSTAVQEALQTRQPMPLQQAAIDSLDQCDDPRGIALALENWSEHTPSIQSQILEMVFRRPRRVVALFEAVEQGKVPPSMVAAVYRQRLLEHEDEAIRTRAKKLFGNVADEAERIKRLGQFAQALNGKPDLQVGATVFKKNCSACHRFAGKGGLTGPDLSSMGARPAESLLLEILQPSDKITAGYVAYLAQTVDGQAFTGTVSEESVNSVTLQLASGQPVTLLRNQIEQLKALSQSLMPANLDSVLTPDELAAVIAYLRLSNASPKE
ncbi:MAG: c-type cytochrome [Pirellulales bacterium]|nr:c-type cytochrome [Pirellulales bacterium]